MTPRSTYYISILRWKCLLCGLHDNHSDAKRPLYTKWTFLPRNVNIYIFAYNQHRLSILAHISMFIAPMTILGPFCCFISGIYLVIFFPKYSPKKDKTTSHLDGHQHAYPNYSQPWQDHWYFFDSIKTETSKYMCLENHVPMSKVAGSSLTGGTMNWMRWSGLWIQRHTS